MFCPCTGTAIFCPCTGTHSNVLSMYWYSQQCFVHVLVLTEMFCPCTGTHSNVLSMYWYSRQCFVHVLVLTEIFCPPYSYSQKCFVHVLVQSTSHTQRICFWNTHTHEKSTRLQLSQMPPWKSWCPPHPKFPPLDQPQLHYWGHTILFPMPSMIFLFLNALFINSILFCPDHRCFWRRLRGCQWSQS